MANLFLTEESEPGDRYVLLAGYGLGVGYMSIVGPLIIGLMHGSSSRKGHVNNLLAYFSQGYNFLTDPIHIKKTVLMNFA